ncbi:MAG: adenylosuccinate synthetase [Flavobacteriaceae bacterium]|nr:adenylosuccinate synthetase [Flavobacteriaceae bacterium]
MKKFLPLIIFLYGFLATAQQPTHVPSPQNNSPINLNSWFDVIVFIILPIILIVIYFMWRRQVKMDKEKEKGNS